MFKIYQVEDGETLESIADKVSTDVENLRRINGINGNVMIRPGSFLIVPTVDDRFIRYKVEKGDSIYSISSKYGVDPDLVLRLNGLNKDDYIYPEQEILIPNNDYKFYVTKKDDTLSTVSEKLKENIIDILNNNETLFLSEDQLIIYK